VARRSWRKSVNQALTHAARIMELVGCLHANGPAPLFVFDAGYDPVRLALDLGEARVATLARLRKSPHCTPSRA